MSPDVVPPPAWLAGVGALPLTGAARVLGRLNGEPHVVALCVSRDEEPGEVAKHYPSGNALHVAGIMRALGHALGPKAPLAVPAVLACESQGLVLVQTAARGRPLLPLLQSDDRSAALRAAGRALACLHQQRVFAGRLVTMSDHLRDLIHPHPEMVADALTDIGGRVRALMAALLGRDRATVVERAVPIHRDVHARQMFLEDDQRVWMVDWDLFAYGDPALDVANFSVYLRTHLTNHAEDAALRFLSAYAEAGGDVSKCVATHMALTYLRLVCKAHRLRGDGWRDRVDNYLARAEAHLTE